MELLLKYLSVVLLWVLWCVLHSAMISIRATDYLKKKLGEQYRFYRLFFNIVSLITLVPVMYCSISLPQAPVFRWEGTLLIVKYILLATSIYLFVAGAQHYNMSQFLGIRQIKTGRANLSLSGHDTFDTSGILNAVRHPWYTAGIMIVWARDMSLSNFLINIVISAYFIIGTVLEERKLVLEFGEKYREYQKNVSMLIPYKWLKARIAGSR